RSLFLRLRLAPGPALALAAALVHGLGELRASSRRLRGGRLLERPPFPFWRPRVLQPRARVGGADALRRPRHRPPLLRPALGRPVWTGRGAAAGPLPAEARRSGLARIRARGLRTEARRGRA